MDTGATSHVHANAGILKFVLDNHLFSSSILVGDGSSIPMTKMGLTIIQNNTNIYTLTDNNYNERSSLDVILTKYKGFLQK